MLQPQSSSNLSHRRAASSRCERGCDTNMYVTYPFNQYFLSRWQTVITLSNCWTDWKHSDSCEWPCNCRNVPSQVRSNPVLPWWIDADTRSRIKQLCKEQMGNRTPCGMLYYGPGFWDLEEWGVDSSNGMVMSSRYECTAPTVYARDGEYAWYMLNSVNVNL